MKGLLNRGVMQNIGRSYPGALNRKARRRGKRKVGENGNKTLGNGVTVTVKVMNRQGTECYLSCAHVRCTCKSCSIRDGVLRWHISAIPFGSTAFWRQRGLYSAPQVPQDSLESSAKPSVGASVPCRPRS